MKLPISALHVDVKTIPSSRVTLRPVDVPDAHAILDIWSDPEVMRFYDLAPFTALAEVKLLIAGTMQESAKAITPRAAPTASPRVRDNHH
jgi:ribosomal-protein-alanine N-acetyltransferase